MKNKLFFYIVGAFLFGLLGATIFNSQKLQTQETEVDVAKFNYGDGINQNQNLQLNEQNCLADDCLLVDDVEYPVSVLPAAIQEALAEAINDEYKALATYEAVIAKFGATRPFSMIKVLKNNILLHSSCL